MYKPPKGKHVAGIIPLSGRDSVLNFPWPDYLTPIDKGYLAVERAVTECALAGCDSIWIVCGDDVSPLLKHRLGDYVLDPIIFENWDFIKRKTDHEKYIPLYYTPISQKDRDRRDSLGWSILHGALTSFVISSKISSWAVPSKYFVSFPYGIYNPFPVIKNRTKIRGEESFYIEHDGSTVRDNKYLGFTFFPQDWLKFKRQVKKNCTGGNKNIPVHERWSSRNFTLDKIFNLDIIDIQQKLEIDYYFSLDSWQDLKECYMFEQKIYNPSKKFIKPYHFKRGIKDEED